MKTEVRGTDELIAKLQDLRKTKAKAAIRKGSRAGSKIVQARAKATAPAKTGVLRNAIKVRALPRSRRWVGTQVATKVADNPAYYGSFVELGTKKIKARGYLKKASEQTKSAALSAFVAGIEAEIAQVGK